MTFSISSQPGSRAQVQRSSQRYQRSTRSKHRDQSTPSEPEKHPAQHQTHAHESKSQSAVQSSLSPSPSRRNSRSQHPNIIQGGPTPNTEILLSDRIPITLPRHLRDEARKQPIQEERHPSPARHPRGREPAIDRVEHTGHDLFVAEPVALRIRPTDCAAIRSVVEEVLAANRRGQHGRERHPWVLNCQGLIEGERGGF